MATNLVSATGAVIIGSTRYSIRLLDNLLNPLKQIDDPIAFNIAGGINTMGVLEMTLPYNYYNLLQKDFFISIIRTVQGGLPYQEQDQLWIIRLRGRKLDSEGRLVCYLKAYSGLHLLYRKINPNYTGSAQSSKTASADNMAKAVVRENLGTLAAAGRQLPTTFFSVQADVSLCPSISDTMPYKTILNAVDDIAQASFTAGTFMAYDVVWNGISYEFRTWANYRGANRTRNNGILSPVILIPEMGALSDIEQSEDWTDEATIIYSGGQGEGIERNVQTAADTTRISGPIGLFEGFIDARNSDTSASVLTEAQAELRSRRAKKSISGTYNDTAIYKYGRDIFLGDVFTAVAFGASVDVRLESVMISVSDNSEKVDIRLLSNE
jgi:hypothetical protein